MIFLDEKIQVVKIAGVTLSVLGILCLSLLDREPSLFGVDPSDRCSNHLVQGIVAPSNHSVQGIVVLSNYSVQDTSGAIYESSTNHASEHLFG